MWDVKRRTIYCPKVDKAVTITGFACHGQDGNGFDCQTVSGILSCSFQDECAMMNPKHNSPVYPWGECPACDTGRQRQKKPEKSDETPS